MKDQRATELDPNFVLAATTRCLVSIMLQAINKICFPNSDKAPLIIPEFLIDSKELHGIHIEYILVISSPKRFLPEEFRPSLVRST
jgi:hypothetical protein